MKTASTDGHTDQSGMENYSVEDLTQMIVVYGKLSVQTLHYCTSKETRVISFFLEDIIRACLVLCSCISQNDLPSFP